MPQPEKVKKLQSILKVLQKQLAKSPAITLAGTFRSHRLPGEYSKLLLEMGVIIKLDSGSRGPSSYAWNKEFSPDYLTASEVILRYNKLRTNEKERRNGGQSEETNKEILNEVRSALGFINARMSRIEKHLGIELENL